MCRGSPRTRPARTRERRPIRARADAKTARGDAAAFRALTDLHLGKIMSFAYRILHDRSEAEDVAQETFLRLWKEAARYEPRARVSTWLHRIAHNLCIDRMRRTRERPTEDADEERTSQEPGGLLDPAKSSRPQSNSALAALPERQRTAITLVHYQGLSNIEAAEVLEVKVDALESLLARGRRTLERIYGPWNGKGLHREGRHQRQGRRRAFARGDRRIRREQRPLARARASSS